MFRVRRFAYSDQIRYVGVFVASKPKGMQKEPKANTMAATKVPTFLN